MKLFRIFRSPFCAAVLACDFGCSSIPSQAAIVPGSKDLGAIWCIGDSITQSNADGDTNGSPRKSLYSKLLAAGYTFTYTGTSTANIDGLPTTGSDPASNLYQYHNGMAGWAIADVTNALPSWWTSGRLAVVKPNVILLMIGANDVDRLDLQPFVATDAMARLTTLINSIYAQPGVGNPTIMVAAITPIRDSVNNSPKVAAFNAGVPGVVQYFQSLGKDIYMVDHFTTIDANFATAMTSDNLHPNSVGNNYIAQNWFNAIQGCVGIPTVTATVSNTQVVLTWPAISGATGYNVKRSTVSGGGYTLLATNVATPTYTDSSLIAGPMYYYMVSSLTALGESENSPEARASLPLATALYIGDDAVEGATITAGAGGGADSLTNATYNFVMVGTTYTNTSGSAQIIQLTQVNCWAGFGSGQLTPFVSVYTGGQTQADVQNRMNYSVISIGSAIPVTANSGRQNRQFLVGGLHPSVTLNPGAVLTAGFQASGAYLIKNIAGGGLMDYMYSSNSLPATLSNPFTANSTSILDRTLKFNIGLGIVSQNVVATNAVSVVYQVSGSQIQFSWPADHIGWRLQAQTNALEVGLGTNWSDVPDATLTNQVTIPISLTSGSVFFRLVYP